MKKKRDGIKLVLTESQYNDPKMQELIRTSEEVEVISDEAYEKMLENMVTFDDEDKIEYIN